MGKPILHRQIKQSLHVQIPAEGWGHFYKFTVSLCSWQRSLGQTPCLLIKQKAAGCDPVLIYMCLAAASPHHINHLIHLYHHTAPSRTTIVHHAYSHFSVSNPVCPLHTAITHVITVLELPSSRANCHWNSSVSSNTLITWVIAVCDGQAGLETLEEVYLLHQHSRHGQMFHTGDMKDHVPYT